MKLTNAQISEIRHAYYVENHSIVDLATIFLGSSNSKLYSQIKSILLGKSRDYTHYRDGLPTIRRGRIQDYMYKGHRIYANVLENMAKDFFHNGVALPTIKKKYNIKGDGASSALLYAGRCSFMVKEENTKAIEEAAPIFAGKQSRTDSLENLIVSLKKEARAEMKEQLIQVIRGL